MPHTLGNCDICFFRNHQCLSNQIDTNNVYCIPSQSQAYIFLDTFCCTTTLSIMTFSLPTLTIKGSYVTVSMNDTQHNNALPLCWESFLLCRVTFCCCCSVFFVNTFWRQNFAECKIAVLSLSKKSISNVLDKKINRPQISKNSSAAEVGLVHI